MEWQTTNGELIALSPKCYLSEDKTNNDVKRGTKGIPYQVQMDMGLFRDVLYNNKKHQATTETLRLNKNRQMCRASLTKTGISDVFVKFQVADDKITCSPLQINGNIL